jgi:hypothetical protein
MAENESLDLGKPGGQRWIDVVDAVKKQQSPEMVAHKASRKLPKALRKAFKEFAEAGVSFEEFLRNRNDPKALARLVRKCQGHEYAHLFAETAAAEADADNCQLIGAFSNGIVDRVTDQIIQELAGGTVWPDLPSIRRFFSQVRRCLEPDIQRIAKKLADDPSWSPTVRRGKKDGVANPTQDLLTVSLLGMTKK